jgi:Fe-S cluster assembly protein SufD
MSVASLPATQSLIGVFTPEAFAAHLASLPPLPEWWLDRKRAAYERFASLPMPTRSDESWRFSNLGTLSLDGYTTEVVPSKAIIKQSEARMPLPDPLPKTSVCASFFNNVSHGLPFTLKTSAEFAARGVIFMTLAEAVVKHPDLIKSHFMAQPQKLGSEKFTALHTAFVNDGAFIYVPPGVEISEPIIILHRASDKIAVFPHTLVIAEENTKITICERFDSSSSASNFACGANDLYAAHGAQLTYIAAQNWSRETLSFQFNSTIVRRDARVQSLNLHLGARQARHESLSQLAAPGAFSEMLAVTVAEGAQEFDQRTLQIHQAPNTKSDLLYKNALLDTAKTVFSGLIVVDPDAQQTDAYQSNRNLMLSETAEAHSLPGLEIQANDVRCTHGATTSRIDPEQEFYLQSRGIGRQQADELLTFGFFEEVLSRLTNDELHDALRALIQTKFKQ